MTTMAIPRKGLAVVISGPSGCGKSTVCRRLVDLAGYRRSVSVTTRPPRPRERHGADYHFVTRDEFERMRRGGELLESSEHFGNLYGTPRGPVEEALTRGETVVLEIDVNGADQVAETMPSARRVFIMPPNRQELERRLRTRNTEDEDAVRLRLARTDLEMSRASSFDLVVVNDDLARVTSEVHQWVEAEARRADG
jgi:guanylate kinase